jgi:hypothetical protein
MGEQWIVVRNWDKFQHYKGRRPSWIKVYVELLQDPNYLGLTETQRALLHGLWLMYATSNTRLHHNVRTINSHLNLRAQTATYEALIHAGFIEVSASKPLAPRYQDASLETEEDKDTEEAAASKGDQEAHTAAADKLETAMKAIGWNHGQRRAGHQEPERAMAWITKANAVAQRNPGGYSWSGHDGGEWPDTPTPNGKPSRPLIDVLRDFIYGPGCHYDDEAILDEIGIHERKRNELLTNTQKTQLLDLANQLRNGME